ncbi:MAG: NAD(P)/FAD-dependent oxidoreductase [Clostridia bacterium]|nr:NAD(P)/FAD-dependent oxidoreductase [Clostridia bacterium]
MYDILIIGGGVVGALCAQAFSGYGVSVRVLEAQSDVAMGASGANSGIVHAGFDAKPGSLKARFNVEGARLMPALCARLGVKYVNNGSLVVGFPGDEGSIRALYERGKENGVAPLEILDAARLHELEPNVSPEATVALYAPSAGIVCPYSLTIAALGLAMDNGAELSLDFRVDRIEDRGDHIRVFSGERFFDGRYLVNCAGLYADGVAAMAGDDSVKITPRSGEYLLLDRRCGKTVSRTIFVAPTKMGKGILVSPTADGNLILGPTSLDIEDKEDKRTTSEGLARVLDGAKRSVPGVPSAVITSFTGLRAVGNTGDFIIKKSAPRMLTFAGIESPGLTSAPALAKYAEETLRAEGILTEKKKDAVSVRRPARFMAELSAAEKDAWIKKDPAYGRIVCRCEEVTEGEIRDALRENPVPRTLDGIKRRVRAGMGRCQGGFCSPVVMRMISDELGIPFSDVTKRGPGSPLTFGKTKGEDR